jgi:hypothetical protein
VHRIDLHIGGWGDDPISRNCGRLGGFVYSGSVSPLMECMSHYMPDNDERIAFVTRVEEMQSPDYHLYIRLYHLCIDDLVVVFVSQGETPPKSIEA